MASDPSERASVLSLSGSHSGSGAVLAPVQVEHFDEYLIVGKLGDGGMAEVFLAMARGPSGFRKLLVIKRLHRHLKDDPALVRMFLDEARLAARLNHPHVVQTNKVGSSRGHHFLAMEYLEGQPLSQVMRRCFEDQTPFPIALGARILSDALDGLDYAHNATDFDGSPLHIVHRDISPHNLFVTYDGQVKVLDFGIAKASTTESNTRTGTIKGKFAYIAPEQARSENVDGRADVWSFGVTMWEVLSGKRLFRRKTDVAVLQATLSETIPPLIEVAPNVPPELSRICERALQRDVEKRWPSAAAMKAELDEWISSASRTTTRASLSAHLKKMFAADIDDRRARIRECIERVETRTGNFPTLPELESPSGPQSDAPTRIEGRTGSASGIVAPARAASLVAVAGPPEPPRRVALRLVLAVLALGLVAAGAWWIGAAGPTQTARPLEPAASAVAAPSVAIEAAIADPVAPGVEPHAAPAIAAIADPVAPGAAPLAARAVAGLAEPPPAAAVTAPVALGRATSRRRPDRDPVAAPVAVPEVTPPAPEPATAAPGRLHLDAVPYAVVWFEGRRLGITPIDVEMPAGTHTLTLRNTEGGLETTYRVTVRSGETTTRTVALE